MQMQTITETERESLEETVKGLFTRLDVVRAAITTSHKAFGYVRFATPLLQEAQSRLHTKPGACLVESIAVVTSLISEAQEYVERAERDIQTLIPETVSV